MTDKQYTAYPEAEVHSYLNVLKDVGKIPLWGDDMVLTHVDNVFINIDPVETYRFWLSWDKLNVPTEKKT